MQVTEIDYWYSKRMHLGRDLGYVYVHAYVCMYIYVCGQVLIPVKIKVQV